MRTWWQTSFHVRITVFLLQNVQVEKEFVSLVEEIGQSRDLHVTHGGVLSNYVLKGPFKKYKGNVTYSYVYVDFRSFGSLQIDIKYLEQISKPTNSGSYKAHGMNSEPFM